MEIDAVGNIFVEKWVYDMLRDSMREFSLKEWSVIQVWPNKVYVEEEGAS